MLIFIFLSISFLQFSQSLWYFNHVLTSQKYQQARLWFWVRCVVISNERTYFDFHSTENRYGRRFSVQFQEMQKEDKWSGLGKKKKLSCIILREDYLYR